MKYLNFYLLVATTLFYGACSNEEYLCTDELASNIDENQVVFDAALQKSSRASDTQFDIMDNISVFAVKAESSSSNGYIQENGNFAHNIRYTYDGNHFTSENGIRIKGNDEKFFYHAVYPYSSVAGPVFYFHVENNQQGENYTKSDLCTAHTDATDQTEVALHFTHHLSKVIIQLKGDNWPAGDMSFKFIDVKTGAQINLNTLKIYTTDTQGDVICADNGTKSFKAILPPQRFAENSQIGILTINGENYRASIGRPQVLEAGKHIKFVYTLNSSRSQSDYSGTLVPYE